MQTINGKLYGNENNKNINTNKSTNTNLNKNGNEERKTERQYLTQHISNNWTQSTAIAKMQIGTKLKTHMKSINETQVVKTETENKK
jgi:hypothetical protein